MTDPGKLLVIGSAGLVGRNIVRAGKDREVVTTWHHERVEGGIRLDITERHEVMTIVGRERPGVIILAAADPFVERCEREPEVTRRVNVAGTAAVAEAADKFGAILVVFSSEYVFDGKDGPYAEEVERRPINEYGRQKVEVEDIARRVNGLICRTSGVFGWEPQRKNFVCQLIDRLRSNREFTVPSDQTITPTYAPALAAAVVSLVSRNARGTLHVVGPKPLMRTAFAELVARTFGLDTSLLRPRPTAEFGLAASRPLNCGLRDDRLRTALGQSLPDVSRALTDMKELEPR